MQQIVGAAPTIDEHTQWTFKHSDGATEVPITGHGFSSGNVVRVEHLGTHKNLHSHADRQSPVSKQKEITAFGSLGVGDPNDDWELTIVSAAGEKAPADILLRHVNAKHYLHSHDTLLSAPPISGSGEVTGIAVADDPNNVWIVEPLDLSPVPLSKASVTIEIAERQILATFESTTSLSRWLDAAYKWVSSEAERWAWLTAIVRNLTETERRAIAAVLTPFENAFRQLNTAIKTVGDSLDTEIFEASLKNLPEAFRNVYARSNPILYSGEPAGAFVANLAKTDPAAAAVALSVLAGQNPTVQNAKAVRGVNEATAFLEGSHPELGSAHKKAFDDLRQAWEDAARATVSALNKDISAAEQQLRTLGEKASAFDQRSDKLIADKTASIAALENTLSKKVALDVSIGYWIKRAKSTRVTSKWFGVAAIVAFILSGAAIYLECENLFGSDKGTAKSVSGTVTTAPATVAHPPVTTFSAASQQVDVAKTDEKQETQEERSHQYWRYLSVGITLTLCVWVCRIVVKIAMSNLHISTDADERVVMLQTFLSLISDKSIDRQEDMKLILQTVFRPGSTGLIDEDSGMQTPLEMILKHAGETGKTKA